MARQDKERYAKELRSAPWIKFRAQWYARHGRYCRACFVTKPCDLHHVDYSRRGHERDSDVICLCRKHHNLAHAYWDSGKYRNRKDATMAMVSDIHRKYRFNGPSPIESLGKLVARMLKRLFR